MKIKYETTVTKCADCPFHHYEVVMDGPKGDHCLVREYQGEFFAYLPKTSVIDEHCPFLKKD